MRITNNQALAGIFNNMRVVTTGVSNKLGAFSYSVKPIAMTVAMTFAMRWSIGNFV